MTDINDMAPTEAAAVYAISRQAMQPAALSPEMPSVYVVPSEGGGVEVLDIEKYADRPRRKRGTVVVRDAGSFARYVTKHEVAGETEIYADASAAALIAVLNAHQGVAPVSKTERDAGAAGWGDHRARLELVKTPAWAAWEKLNGQLMSQQAFAEHLEQRLVDVVKPSGADMLELAQTFQATKNAAFDSSQRLSTGEVQIAYKENIDAKAGKSGRLSIPETFELGLVPFEGAKAYKVTARFRYRLHDANLAVGFVLERPEDILRAAFDDVITAVQSATEAPILNGRPA